MIHEQSIKAAETEAGNLSAGFLEYQARRNFRDLCRIYGFGGAREIFAEIINAEADRAGRYRDA